MQRHRNFIFTWNNYTNDNEQYLKGLPSKFMVFGREIAPTTATPHLQGYICFANGKTITAAKRLLRGCHVEIARGSHAQCRTYSIKDGDFYEQGTLPVDRDQNGLDEKQRWIDAWDSAKAGALEEIPADIRIRSYSTLKRIARDYQPNIELLDSVCGLWIHGTAGCGKTSAVFQAYPGLYPKGHNKWWCGYQGEEIVLLDDIDTSHGPWIGSFLKRWADKYPFIAEEKGGSTKIRPRRFIVTSQYPDRDWETLHFIQKKKLLNLKL